MTVIPSDPAAATAVGGTAPLTPGGITPLSLRRNFSWTLAGNITYAACQWGMLVVLARLGGPVAVGLFALGLAVTAPVALFAGLALRQVQATDARRDFVFAEYLALRLGTTLIALASIAVITWAAGYRGEYASVILLVGLAKGFEAVSEIYHGLFQQRERLASAARSMIIKGVGSLGALAAVMYATGSVIWSVLALACVWGIVLVAYDVPVGLAMLGPEQQRRPVWPWRRLMKLAWLALPLGIVLSLLSLNTNVPRYFVEQHLGTSQLGVFAALAYLLLAGGQVVAALGQSASPRLARYFRGGEINAYRLLLLRLVALGLGVGLGGILIAAVAGRPLLRMVYGDAFAQWSDVLLIVMAAGALSYVAGFLGYGMTAAGQFRVQPLVGFLSLAATVGACVVLIPSWGLRGAAAALVAGAAVQVLGSAACIAVAIKRANVRARLCDGPQLLRN